MKTTKYLLIGSGLASHNAAKAIRQIDPQGQITLVGSEPHRPYNRPPLTKEYLQGKDPLEKAFLEPPDFYTQQRIELMLSVSVERLDLAGKVATLSGGGEISFEKALLATGGRPVTVKTPGAGLRNVQYFRTMDDASALSAAAGKFKRLAVVGGGFIGMEIASSLTQRGVEVTVIDGGPHIWSRFAGPELARFFQDYCQARGVKFLNAQRLKAIQGDRDATAVLTESGQTVPCDFVCLALGIVPNVELAQQAGLAVDNGVVVDEFLRASHPDVYAAGDLCNYPDPYFGRPRRVEHWGQADYTGTLAGQNMAGQAARYDMMTYVWSDIFDLHLEFAGDEHASDRQLLRGRYQDKAFSVLYLKDNRLTAHFSVNLKRKQFSPLQKLIEKKIDLAGKDDSLRDVAFDIATLLPPAPTKA